MHWKTYHRLKAEYDNQANQALQGMAENWGLRLTGYQLYVVESEL